MDIRDQFGNILRDLRKAKGLTQEELAFRAGMSVPYLSDLERGKNNPSLAVLVDLARALDAEVVELVAGLDISDGQGPTSRKRTADQ